MSGAWEIDQNPSETPGLLPYVYVDHIDGGEIVDGPRPEGDLRVATFRDPAGNVLGIWNAGDP